MIEMTDEEIDAVTDVQWGSGCMANQYLAHRTAARAYIAAHEAKKQQVHLVSDCVVDTVPGDDQFFDGGWCWMRHPEWNGGNAIPVKMVQEGDARFYLPFEPHDATEFDWDRRDDEWEIIAPWNSDVDKDFALFAAKAAGGHLSSLADELRASNAALEQRAELAEQACVEATEERDHLRAVMLAGNGIDNASPTNK